MPLTWNQLYEQYFNDPKLAQLAPGPRAAAAQAFANLHLAGYSMLSILETVRSRSRQAFLYGHGRTPRQLIAAGADPIYSQPHAAKVTYSRPGRSQHEKRNALDVKVDRYPQRCWPVIARYFKACGFSWGGDWRIRDYRHFEYRGK